MSRFTPHDITAWAGQQTVGASKSKAVLNALALFADRITWECWPSFALISQYTEIPERSVSRAVAELERKGFILRERIRRRDGSLAGWRFKLNPKGVEIVIPAAPAMTAAEAEDASEAADQPDAKLAGGDQDAGEHPANGAPDVDLNHPPNQPGGETATVVNRASPAANGGGSKGTTTENDSPLPPKAPADRSLAEMASGGGLETRAPDASPCLDAASAKLDRFRALALAAFGAAQFKSWLDDLRIVEEIRDDASSPRVTVRLATASAVRADRILAQMKHRLADIWRAVGEYGPEIAVRATIEVDEARQRAAMAAHADQKRRAAERAREGGPEGARRQRRRA